MRLGSDAVNDTLSVYDVVSNTYYTIEDILRTADCTGSDSHTRENGGR